MRKHVIATMTEQRPNMFRQKQTLFHYSPNWDNGTGNVVSDEKTRIFSVTEFNLSIREILDSLPPLWLTGEIGNLSIQRSGHVYLTLKDQYSQLRCTFFSGARFCIQNKLKEGMQIEVYGVPSLYKDRGDFQFNIKKMKIAGEGDLNKKFEELKSKLMKEGLFAEEHKTPVPRFPKTIGLVTSPEGAAIKDFLRIANLRFPGLHYKIYPSAVQGKGAEHELASGVEFFNHSKDVDVIVITRGGGSLEDLWPFNEEILARAIYASKIPVVSAVGHEVDFSICDFVADIRVATPTAAAEYLTPDKAELQKHLDSLNSRLTLSVNYCHDQALLKLNHIMSSKVFKETTQLVQDKIQKIDLLCKDAENALKRALEQAFFRKQRLDDELNAIDPFKVLKRGYAFLLAPETCHQFTSVSELEKGQHIQAVMADGFADLSVNEIDDISNGKTEQGELFHALLKKQKEKKNEP